MRQTYGVRAATQVDDICMMSSHGVAEACIDVLCTICELSWFRLLPHLKGDKANTMLPRSVFTFDGRTFCPQFLRMFSIAEQAERHARDLSNVLQRFERSNPVSLREFVAVLMQQQHQSNVHWPTNLQLCVLKEHLAAQHRHLHRARGPNRMWDARVDKPSSQCLAAMRELTQPKAVGQFIRAPGRVVASILYDVSDQAIGYKLTDYRTGAVRVGHVALDQKDLGEHHTVKELRGAPTLVTGVVQQLDLQAVSWHQPLTVRVRNDNTAAVSNLRKGGRLARMVECQQEMRCELAARGLHLDASYASKHVMDNLTNVDFHSRMKIHNGQFGVSKETFQRACEALEFFPSIDMFGDKVTAQTHLYVSRYPETKPRAVATDAFSLDWSREPVLLGHTLYCFPPPMMIDQTVERILNAKRQCLLVMPLWDKVVASWPRILEAACSFCIAVPHSDLYVHPQHLPIPLAEVPPWPLLFVTLSTAVSRRGAWTSPPPTQSASPTFRGMLEPTLPHSHVFSTSHEIRTRARHLLPTSGL